MALDVAATALQGPLTRTATSVIGSHEGETVICAATPWGFSAMILLTGSRIWFVVEPAGRGARSSLNAQGEPWDLVARVLDEQHQARLLALAPIGVRLAVNGLHLEKRGVVAAADVAATIDLAASLARRVRSIERETSAGRTRLGTSN